MSPFDVVSAAQRLALIGQHFVAALEYAKAISKGLVEKFVDALMTALGNATTLSTEDICTILDLYVDVDIVCKVPP